MVNNLTIPHGKNNARFEVLKSQDGDSLNLSYWTWSAKAGFHTPYASFQIPLETLPVLYDWLGKIALTHCK